MGVKISFVGGSKGSVKFPSVASYSILHKISWGSQVAIETHTEPMYISNTQSGKKLAEGELWEPLL